MDESGLIRASSIQAYAQVIDYTYGRFVDSFSGREIGGQLAGDYNLPVQKAQAFVYLPLLLKEADHRPDLVVEELVATHEAITVVIKNNGPGPVVDGFWVDVYIDPVEPPVLNRHWWEIAEQGLVWGITSPLPAGESLILTIGDSYYAEPHSDFTGTLPAGISIWAQVDSVNPATAYGGVQEHNEDNNLTGPIQAGTETAGISLSGDSLPSGSTISLPPRRLAGQ